MKIKLIKENIERTTVVPARGDVVLTVETLDGNQTITCMRNTLLRAGKVAVASSLAREIEDPYDFYIDKMIFGTNGTAASTPKYVDENRTGLFGTTLLTKNVIASIDSAAPTTCIFTSVILFSEGNASFLNEMALQMKNGDLYSMLTFPDLGKTSQVQLTFNWRISFL